MRSSSRDTALYYVLQHCDTDHWSTETILARAEAFRKYIDGESAEDSEPAMKPSPLLGEKTAT